MKIDQLIDNGLQTTDNGRRTDNGGRTYNRERTTDYGQQKIDKLYERKEYTDLSRWCDGGRHSQSRHRERV